MFTLELAADLAAIGFCVVYAIAIAIIILTH